MAEDRNMAFQNILNETISYCDKCESQVHDFIKIANCVLTKEEYYEFLEDYRRFENNFGILESLSTQISNPISTLEAISIGATVKEIRCNIDDLVDVMVLSNIRIDNQCINVEMATLIEKLEDLIEFDAIDYESFSEGMTNSFLILNCLDVLDKTYKSEYYPMIVLKVESFKDKVSAYEYALKHGIRKDFVIQINGHHV